MPEKLNIGWLLLDIVLTAVLPGICEEFTNRGGLLTTMRSSFNPAQTTLIVGLAFGLFHQNITQLFYPMLFGMLMAVLVMKTKSIYPAIIVHFMNNALSVYIDYASVYPALPFHNFINSINMLTYNFLPVVVMMWAGVVAVGVGLFILILRLTKGKTATKTRVVSRVGGITILAVEGEEIEENEARPLEDTQLYKPTLRDSAFYIGSLVITIVTTIVTFYWGTL